MRFYEKRVTVAVVLSPRYLALWPGAQAALTIEDYYRIKTIGDAQISPNGQWVAYSLSTRIEEDNTTSTETYVVNADGSGTARRIMHAGGNGPARDGPTTTCCRIRWRAHAERRVHRRAARDAGPSRERHPFKVAVDTPDATPSELAARPRASRAPMENGSRRPKTAPGSRGCRRGDRLREASCGSVQGPHLRLDALSAGWPGLSHAGSAPEARRRITIAAVGGGTPKTITSLGMRPANVAWHPNGTAIAFTADEVEKRTGLRAPRHLHRHHRRQGDRLTTDGYVWSSLAYSPDGRFLLAERTFGTDMIIKQRLSHGGSDDRSETDRRRRDINLTASWDLEPNARAGRPMAGMSTSPRRRAAPRTCSASPRRRMRPSNRSRKASGG